MMKYEGRWVRIQAYKHNGELHRAWSHGFVLVDNDQYLVLISVRSSVVEHDGRKWHTKEPAVFVFFKEEWLNVIAMLKEKDVSYYVNIASPAIIDNNCIKYIDYDLDVKLLPGGSTKLLDQNEYERHAYSLDYSDDIKKALAHSVSHIYEMIKKRDFPFIDEEIKNLYNEFVERYSRVKV
ncbi:MAG: DUF402 domain-containing protein [Bacilli bacterium]|jgi:hypothetical protein